MGVLQSLRAKLVGGMWPIVGLRSAIDCIVGLASIAGQMMTALVHLLAAALVVLAFSATPAAADIPALCAPAKARHDNAMAAGNKSAVLAARERIKALDSACPQLWAAVRNASLPREKDQAKAPPSVTKAEPKPQSSSSNLDRLTQSLLKQGYRLYDEPTISQPATTFAGDGDPADSRDHWYLWRTQEGCYFFKPLPIWESDGKGLALQKKGWRMRLGQFRWKGQCTPGKLISGSGTLEEEARMSGSHVTIGRFDRQFGTMINGLWNGTIHSTTSSNPNWPGLYFEYRMGCYVNPAKAFNCQSPRIPRELMAGVGGPGGG